MVIEENSTETKTTDGQRRKLMNQEENRQVTKRIDKVGKN
jgi:hypothetical protein